MSFQFRFMLKMGGKCLFSTKGTDARLTRKRVGIILFMTPWYVLLLIVNWTCLLLDEVLFRGFRKHNVEKPLFIVGPPRSGTTFLHRLIARDDQFTTMKTWEILFAPSVVQKKFWHAMGKIDDFFGSPVQEYVKGLEKRILHQFNTMHRASIFEPEEDELVLINIFASYFIGLVIPFTEHFRPFVHFDDDIPREVRLKIMRFYKKCVQRHLYVYGNGKYFLSKNPSFSSKVETINEVFPDSRVICTVRTPLETVPSTMSLYTFSFRLFNSLREDSPVNGFILDLLSHWYRYPLEKLTQWSEERHSLVEYNELVEDPMDSVLGCYKRMGYKACYRTQQMLSEEKSKAMNYRSRHDYNVEKFNLSCEQIAEDFIDIFQRFRFNTLELVN